MEPQDNNFNYKIILAALAAVIIGILIAFYYSNAQSNNEISILEIEKGELVESITFLQAKVDELKALDEANNVTMAQQNDNIQQLRDSIGQLNFDITKQKEYRRKLWVLEGMYDSIKTKNSELLFNNEALSNNLTSIKKEMDNLKAVTRAYAKKQEDLIKKNRELQEKYATKIYLNIEKPEGNGIRVRSGSNINTDKASVVARLKGSVTIKGIPDNAGVPKVIFFQFLDPDKRVIAHNANIININGNDYSRMVEFIASASDIRKESYITVPVGSLKSGIYTFNVFEDEKLLSTVEFGLK